MKPGNFPTVVKSKPGLKEHALIAAILRLVVGYCGHSVDRMLIVKAFTRSGMPLAGFRARDFDARVDLATLIA